MFRHCPRLLPKFSAGECVVEQAAVLAQSFLGVSRAAVMSQTRGAEVCGKGSDDVVR